MTLVAPLSGSTTNDQNLVFPIILFDSYDTKIQLDILTPQDKNGFYGMEISNQSNDGKNMNLIVNRHPAFNTLTDMERAEAMKTNLKVLITQNTNHPTELQKIHDDLDFVLRVLIGKCLPFHKFTEAGPMHEGPGIGRSHTLFVISRRSDIMITNEICSRISKLYSNVKHAKPATRKKLDFIYALLKIANRLFNTNFERGFACAIFVTILESLYVPKKIKNTTKKFSERIAKEFPDKIDFVKTLKGFYNKRCTVFHGNASKYPLNMVTMKEMSTLEEIVCDSIERYAINPERFTDENLDNQPLQTTKTL